MLHNTTLHVHIRVLNPAGSTAQTTAPRPTAIACVWYHVVCIYIRSNMFMLRCDSSKCVCSMPSDKWTPRLRSCRGDGVIFSLGTRNEYYASSLAPTIAASDDSRPNSWRVVIATCFIARALCSDARTPAQNVSDPITLVDVGRVIYLQ